MSGYWIQILIFTVALLFFCWLLLEYWYYRKEKNPESRLYLASKAAFAFVHFWKAVDSAKEIRRIPSKISGTLYSGRGICRKHSHTDAGKRRKRVPCDRT